MPWRSTDDLKAGLAREARKRGSSKAEVIRQAIADAIAAPSPCTGFLDAEPVAERVDELLQGFGSR
ncbi:MAG: ribbon-helix-helix protein, CopG family [Actinomycetota bacterium]